MSAQDPLAAAYKIGHRPRLSRRRVQAIAAALESLLYTAPQPALLRVPLTNRARRDAQAAYRWALMQMERRRKDSPQLSIEDEAAPPAAAQCPECKRPQPHSNTCLDCSDRDLFNGKTY